MARAGVFRLTEGVYRTMDEVTATRRDSVQSVERAFDLLEALAEGGERPSSTTPAGRPGGDGSRELSAAAGPIAPAG